MFDYSKLDSLDFEKLCGDIMSRKLKRNLRYFPPGRDGGIDLVDDVIEKNILIQVKHYEKSSYSSFKNALKIELEKVKKLQPKQYYIFTSQSLSPDNIKEVFNMFMDYMDNESNIVTREDINMFLKLEENIDILRSHFKLWITADNVLKDFLNQDVFLDSEILLSDIDEEIKYFVQTNTFNSCLNILEEERKILLYGDPGVGKTLNSKMLLLNYVKKGYRIRYSSNAEIGELKKSVTSNKEIKEVIFLDDFLGQYYFNLKEGRDQELLSLIKHVDLYRNKVLILNSRVTILNEALAEYVELYRYFGSEKINLQKINMSEISAVEKAKIFHSMLKKNNVSNSHYSSVRKNRNYLNVVQHKNFNPRVIEFVTLPDKVKNITSYNYYNFIMNNLNEPKDIWKNEFERRILHVDRIFMYTLYSLTDTYVSIDILEECFNYFISNEIQVDTTLHNFDDTLTRLNYSMVRIVDSYGKKKVGVLNPSINDFMNYSLNESKLLLNKLQNYALYLDQLERLYTPVEFERKISELVNCEKLFEYKTIRIGQLHDIILHIIGEDTILNDRYICNVEHMIVTLSDTVQIGRYRRSKVNILRTFIQNKALFDFYNVRSILSDYDNLERVFSDLDFEDSIELMSIILELLECNQAYTAEISEFFNEKLSEELEFYIDNIDYMTLIHDWCDFETQNEVSQEDFNSIIEEIHEEVQSLILGINNSIIFSNVEASLDNFKETIEFHINDIFKEMLSESNKPLKRNLSETNVSVDDILDRPV